MSRPSSRELKKKVDDALSAIDEKRCHIALTKHLSEAIDCLGIVDDTQLFAGIRKLLVELKSFGPERCYCGKTPPERSYEPQIKDAELWAFSWHSPSLHKKVYLKFVFKKNTFFFVDCHESR